MKDLFGKTVLNNVYSEEASEQRKLRILVSVAAYAYEKESISIISDEQFDEMCRQIKPKVKTGHPVLDQFFQEEFSPDTGMWIHKHPELYLVELYFKAQQGFISKQTYFKRSSAWKQQNRT